MEFAQHGDLEASSEIKRTFLHLSTLPMLSEQIAAALILAKAASPSPAKINQHIVAHTYSYLTPASTIELLVWLSIQQLLHRLGCFYQVMNQL
ncbi:MAG: hypothetical protein QNJ72_02255 [Pleurocapsa sp. MO_226.B13]|nr:hypothetical protein [Pleurocapsa sp. MO_226.B13]